MGFLLKIFILLSLYSSHPMVHSCISSIVSLTANISVRVVFSTEICKPILHSSSNPKSLFSKINFLEVECSTKLFKGTDYVFETCL